MSVDQGLIVGHRTTLRRFYRTFLIERHPSHLDSLQDLPISGAN